ncbi:MAG: hypothetical protein L3J74_16570 [Bacteroidales bacterium]|nr:hypothetical protein [Bacteroidales bacterium]
MDKSKKNAGFIISIIFVLSFGYAILRYNIFGGVLWSRLPMYVVNKALSLSGFILLMINYGTYFKNNTKPVRQKTIKHIGISGFLFILLHAVLSLLLFRPAVYPKFFDENSWLTGFTGISMLSGVVAIVLLWVYNMSFTLLYKEKFTQRLKQNLFNAAILITGFHLFFMGYKGWLTPEKWFGKLPPISLIAFCVFIAGVFVYLVNKSNTKL